jgi:hypothetical protein
MATMKYVNDENKTGENMSRVWRFVWLIFGLLMLLCLCRFKTLVQRGNEQNLDGNIGYKTRQMLQDKEENKRVSFYQNIPLITSVPALFLCLDIDHELQIRLVNMDANFPSLKDI